MDEQNGVGANGDGVHTRPAKMDDGQMAELWSIGWACKQDRRRIKAVCSVQTNQKLAAIEPPLFSFQGFSAS
jgi:hypothetical protein